MRWWLYRAFDASGRLLYVGRTGDFSRRLKQHSNPNGGSEWFPLCSRFLVEVREGQLDESPNEVERRVIVEENPLFNIDRPGIFVSTARRTSCVGKEKGCRGSAVVSVASGYRDGWYSYHTDALSVLEFHKKQHGHAVAVHDCFLTEDSRRKILELVSYQDFRSRKDSVSTGKHAGQL